MINSGTETLEKAVESMTIIANRMEEKKTAAAPTVAKEAMKKSAEKHEKLQSEVDEDKRKSEADRLAFVASRKAT